LDAQRHRLHFGSDPNDLKLLCETKETRCRDLPDLERGASYYWRIDEVRADGSEVRGDVWNFRTGKLLYWWKLDETGGSTALDTVTGIKGMLMGNPTWRSGGGKIAGALTFDGEEDHLLADEGISLDGLNALTVSLWIKSQVTGTDKGFIIFEDPRSHDDRCIRYDASGFDGYGTNVIKAGVTTTGGKALLESSSNVQSTEWQHLTLVWNSGEVQRLYINGEPDTPSYEPEPVAGTLSGYHKVLIGKGGKDRENTSWEGLIDDVRIYNYALTSPEVAALYSGTSPTEALKLAQAGKAKPISIAAKTADASVKRTRTVEEVQ
jgi:hypothetical protein